MKKNKTCCFIGSRQQSLSYGSDENHPDCIHLKELLYQEIVRLIEERGISHFISGLALGVDQWAAELVIRLKKMYPQITLESAIPYETQAVKWNMEQRERYFNIASLCDKETMLQRRYTNDCMQKCSRYLVDSSQIILAVWNGKVSRAGSTVKYALERSKEIVCIDPDTLAVSRLGV